MAKFIVSAETKYVGSRVSATFEIEDEDIEDLSDDHRDALITDTARDLLYDQLISWDWQEA